jgi:hypothetical protein
VVAGALVVVLRVLVFDVTELDGRPGGERPALLLLVPARVGLAEPFVRERDQRVTLGELGVGAAQDQRAVAGNVDVEERAC